MNNTQEIDVPEDFDWSLIVQNSPNHLWRATPEGELDFANARMTEYLGMSRGDVLAGGWAKAVHPADLGQAIEKWREALAEGAPYEAEYRLQSASDGLYYWHRSRARPVPDADGTVRCWIGTNVEINMLKRTVEVADARQEIALRERERMARIMEYAPAAMAFTQDRSTD
jgi:PAS domain S-box-containing protein